MAVECLDLLLQVLVSFHDVVVAESDVVLLLPGYHNLVLNLSLTLVSLIHLLLELSVFAVLDLGLALKIGLVGELAIEVALKSLALYHQPRVVVFCPGKLIVSLLKSLGGTS